MPQSKVSILCPFRNEIGELKETIDSFVKQTYKNKEVILVDSDSTDGSMELAKEYAKKYKFIKYFNNPYKPGRWATEFYIDAINRSTGSIIYMADANGKLAPDYLELTVKHIKGNVAGVVGKLRIWLSDSSISKYRDVIWTLRYDDVKRMEKEVNEGRILPRTFSREIYDKIGGFNPKAGWAIDTFFNKELLKHGYKIVYEPKAIWWHKWRDNPKKLIKYSYKFGKLNYDTAKTDKKQLLKIAYFLLPELSVLLSLFNISFLLILILHPVPLILSTLQLFLKARNHKNRAYVFLKSVISYMQNIPYSIGFALSFFKDLFKRA